MQEKAEITYCQKKNFLQEATPAMSHAVLSLENETLMPLELQPQTKQKLPNEKYGLSESPFLELQEATTQTNGPCYGVAIDQITTVPSAKPQPFQRKRRLVTHSEVIMDRTTYQEVGSQSIMHKTEIQTDNGSKSCKAKSHKDEVETSTAAFLPKLKAKLGLQDLSNKETNPTLLDDGSFPDDVLFIKVPYLRGSKSGVGESESGTVGGYGSKRDLNKVAYHFVLKALYIQGEYKWKHELWLTELRGALGISNDDHLNELKCLISRESVSAT